MQNFPLLILIMKQHGKACCDLINNAIFSIFFCMQFPYDIEGMRITRISLIPFASDEKGTIPLFFFLIQLLKTLRTGMTDFMRPCTNQRHFLINKGG